MTTAGASDPRAARFVDLDLLGCGSLTIALMRALRAASAGEVVEVRARDLGAPADIPAWCGLTGHALLAGPYGADGARYLIRKAGAAPADPHPTSKGASA